MHLLLRSKVSREDRNEIYLTIAERYGWTLDYIASLTPSQILTSYTGVVSKTVTFKTEEEYTTWLKSR
jgi:hypothetical protein